MGKQQVTESKTKLGKQQVTQTKTKKFSKRTTYWGMHTHTMSADNKQTSLKEINPFCKCEDAFSHFLKHDIQRKHQEDKSQTGLEMWLQSPCAVLLVLLRQFQFSTFTQFTKVSKRKTNYHVLQLQSLKLGWLIFLFAATLLVPDWKFFFTLQVLFYRSACLSTLKHLSVSLQVRTSPSIQVELSLCTNTDVEEERD